MKVLLINGSPRADGNTAVALSVVAGELEKEGIKTVTVHVGNTQIRGCVACNGCGKSPDGLCIFRDDPVDDSVRLMEGCDGLVVGSPVYFSGIAGTLKCFLDRFFYCAGNRCAYKPMAAVVALRRSGGVDTFHQINNYFNLARGIIVPSFYWGVVHGSNPQEATQDGEGMQIMRQTGKNMAWLIKTLDYSKDKIPPPPPEKRIYTNFIR